jgi:hypothetical protein
MKFQLLPMGARFEYEGKVYTKVGPLTASGETGGQRMIPRFAVLRPLDGVVAEAPRTPSRKLDEAKVMAALEAFHEECVRLIQAAADDANRAETALSELETARQRLIAGLG